MQVNKRNEKAMKIIAFDLAKNYLLSFTSNKNNKISLVSHDKADKSNNFISKFVYAEHKEGKTDNHAEEMIYFRVCVPEEKHSRAYLDVFCPFSPCSEYKDFLNSKLSCFKDLSPEIRDKIEESNKLQ